MNDSLTHETGHVEVAHSLEHHAPVISDIQTEAKTKSKRKKSEILFVVYLYKDGKVTEEFEVTTKKEVRDRLETCDFDEVKVYRGYVKNVAVKKRFSF